MVRGLENDIDEIKTEVFGGNPGVSRRIYELSREVYRVPAGGQAAHRHPGRPGGRVRQVWHRDPELQRYLRDVQDHAIQIQEQVAAIRDLLQNFLSVNLTLVSLQQNDEVKKISAWAAILFAPTIVTGVYGMNFDYMPELHWLLGYPFALALIVSIPVLLYLGFKRSGWL